MQAKAVRQGVPRLSEDPRARPEGVFLANVHALVIHEANFENSAVVLVQIDEYQETVLRTSKDCKIPKEWKIQFTTY